MASDQRNREEEERKKKIHKTSDLLQKEYFATHKVTVVTKNKPIKIHRNKHLVSSNTN